MGFFRWLLGPPKPTDAELSAQWDEQSRGEGEESIKAILPLLADAESEYQGEGTFKLCGQYQAHQVKIIIDYSFDELELTFDVNVEGSFEIDGEDQEGDDVGLYRRLPSQLRTLVEAVLDEHEGTLELAEATIKLSLEDHEYDDPASEMPALLSLMSQVVDGLEM